MTRGKIISTVLCCTAHHSCARSYEQFLQVSCGLLAYVQDCVRECFVSLISKARSALGAFSCKGAVSAWQAKCSLLLACHRRPVRRLQAKCSLLLACHRRPARRLQVAQVNNASSLPRCTKWRPMMQSIVQHDIQDYLIILTVIQ